MIKRITIWRAFCFICSTNWSIYKIWRLVIWVVVHQPLSSSHINYPYYILSYQIATVDINNRLYISNIQAWTLIWRIQIGINISSKNELRAEWNKGYEISIIKSAKWLRLQCVCWHHCSRTRFCHHHPRKTSFVSSFGIRIGLAILHLGLLSSAFCAQHGAFRFLQLGWQLWEQLGEQQRRLFSSIIW